MTDGGPALALVRGDHQLHHSFSGIFRPYDGHPLVGFNDKFKIGDILSSQPKIFGLGVHLTIAKVSKVN
jgi:hypothetical protein